MIQDFIISICSLIISGAFLALDQLIYFGITDQSWLPEEWFTWALDWKFLNLKKILNARHFYRGMAVNLLAVGFLMFPWIWIIGLLAIWLYWQNFNFFFHIIWRQPRYHGWPW